MLRITMIALLFLGFSFNLDSQNIIRGPYLQVLTTNSVMVCWRTDVATDSKIYYGADLNNQSLSVSDSVQKTDHFITLNNLNSSTQYFYSIANQATMLSANKYSQRFHTAPVNGTVNKYRFWVIGDAGKANQGQVDVMNSFLNYNDTASADFMIMLGDNAYDNGTQQEYQDKLFNVYDTSLNFLPVFSTPGNHDYNSVNRLSDPTQHVGPYYDVFKSPENGQAGGLSSNTKLYYSFDYGNIHFVSLNSELQAWTLTSGGPMFDWLRQDLQANTKEWVICYFHQPPYSKGSHDSDDFWELLMANMRRNALPILEQYGVDLVLCGHSHVYERSKLIKGHTGNSSTFNNATHAISTNSGVFSQGQHYTKQLNGSNEGTVYVVCGNSGSSEPGANLNHPAMIVGDDGYGSLIFEVNGNRLDGKYLKSDNTVFDHFTIVKPDGSQPINTIAIDKSTLDFKLYPNPAKNELNLEFNYDNDAVLEIEVYDISGKNVFKQKLNVSNGKNSKKIDVSKLNSGTFLLLVNNGKIKGALPFVKN